jgi:glycosyltransferase involved in cell wall biosynthesis
MRRERPVLLYVTNVAWFFTSHRLPLACAAREAGYEVHVAAGIEAGGEQEPIEAAGFRFHRLRSVRGDRNPLKELVALWDLALLVRRLRPDIIHAITAKPIILAGFLRRLYSVPAFVGAMTGLGYLFINRSRHRILRTLVVRALRVGLGGNASRLIVQNSHDARLLADLGAVDAANVVLIPGSGVDLGQFLATAEPEGPPVVVLPARMLRDKGVVEFCEAARILRDRGVSGVFRLAGGLDPRNPAALGDDELRRLVSDCGVEWLGHVEDMAGLFRGSNIVCLPSYREGLPKALIEGAACGRAIVTTDVPGCRDVVRDGEEGLLVPARDGASLANALGRLIADPQLRARQGAAAARRARNTFDVRRVCASTIELYESLRSRGLT